MIRLFLALLITTSAAADPLTPFGAERAGNADGSIPAWTGGVTEPPPDYQGPGSVHVDPFAADRPLVVIDSDTRSAHEVRLSPGMLALLGRYPDSFRIPVYPTRRSHSAPAWVDENTRRNETSAALSEGGNGFTGAFGGIPFRQPETALEVYWNHVARWRGQYIESSGTDVNVLANGRFSRISRESRIKFNYYDPEGSADTVDNRLFSLLSRTVAPARQAGGGVLVLETINQEEKGRRAWSYDAGRRRVIRAPNVAFDMAVNAADGLRTADDTDLINGSPARFEWSLLGKRELIIPYNNYRLAGATAEEELLQPGHLNPDRLRYELHRVWVLEGRLRSRWRHVYSRKVLYIDEDSWTAVLAEMYDNQGDLWRVALTYPMNFYELPATLPVLYAYHDLPSGRYHVVGLARPDHPVPRTREPVPSDSQFTPSGLRRFVR